MAEIDELEFLFTADDGGLKEAVDGADTALDELVDKAELANEAFEHAGDGAAEFKTELEETKETVGTFAKLAGEHLPEHVEQGVQALGSLAAAGQEVGHVFFELANPVGIGIAVIAGAVAASVAATGILYEMATSAAEVGNEMVLMSQKTGLSLENIHALTVGADLAGTSMQRIVLGVTQLQFRAEKLGGALKGVHLKIDTTDTNVALEQVFEHIAKIPEGMARTQESMKIFGPRMGRDFGLLVTQMGGDLEKFKAQLEATGTVMSEEDVKAAAKLSTELTLLSHQWEALEFSMEAAAVPIVLEWIKGISGWLTDNKEKIRAWGEEFVKWLDDVSKAFLPLITDVFVDVSTWLNENKGEIISWGQTFISILQGVASFVATVGAGIKALTDELDYLNRATGEYKTGKEAGDAFRYRTGGGTPEFDARFKEAMQAGKLLPVVDLNAPISTTNIVDKRPSPAVKEGKGGGAKDLVAEALAAEELRLRQTLTGYKNEEQFWQDMVSHKTLSLETFTDKALALEEKRYKATWGSERTWDKEGKILNQGEGLMREEQLAQGIKKAEEREKKLQEIAFKRYEENVRHAKEENDLLFSIGEDRFAREQLWAQNTLQQDNIIGQQRQDRIRDNANFRIITEEQAATQLGKIELSLFDEKENLAERERIRAEERLGAEAHLTQDWIKIQGQRTAAEVERAALLEKISRNERDSKKRDLDDARRFADQMGAIEESVLQIHLQTAREILEHRIAIGGMNDPNDQRQARQQIDIQTENLRFEQQINDLRSRERVEAERATYEEIATGVIPHYLKLEEALEAEHAQKIKIIRERGFEEMHRANERLAGTMTNDIDNAITTGFQQGIGAGLRSFGQGILQMIHGAAMRELQQSLTTLFDGLAGKGGIIGKIFSGLTGVKLDPGQAALTSATTADATSTAANTISVGVNTVALGVLTTAVGALTAAMAYQAAESTFTDILDAISSSTTTMSGGEGYAEGGLIQGPGGPKDDAITKHVSAGEYIIQASSVDKFGTGFLDRVNAGNMPELPGTGNGKSGGAKMYNITLNAPVVGGSSYETPRSRREMVEMLTPALMQVLGDIR